MDFTAIEDSWSFDHFRKYALLRCTSHAYQNEAQFELARQYHLKAETLLSRSHHRANIYYFLNQEARAFADDINIESSGKACTDWVLSNEFESSIIQKLSSPL